MLIVPLVQWLLLLPPAIEVWGKVIFLYLSVILFMGGSNWTGTPQGRYTLRCGYNPLGRYIPLVGTPPGRYTPPTVHAGIRSTSGRYASYWNAFLFTIVFNMMSVNISNGGHRCLCCEYILRTCTFLRIFLINGTKSCWSWQMAQSKREKKIRTSYVNISLHRHLYSVKQIGKKRKYYNWVFALINCMKWSYHAENEKLQSLLVCTKKVVHSTWCISASTLTMGNIWIRE